jgi:hypothetical protein
MGLFGRHPHQEPSPSAPPGQASQPGRLSVPGLAEFAAAQRWEPVSGAPLDGTTQELVHDATRSMYGAPRSATYYKVKVGPTSYHDCYRGSASGHQFLVANAWTSVVDLCAVSLGQIRLSWFLGEPVWAEPARYGPIVAARQLESGDPAFDCRFRVRGAHPQTIAELLPVEVRALMMARDDWFFAFGADRLLCICRQGYRSADEVTGRLAELTGIAAALPPPSAQHAAAQPIVLSTGVVYDPARVEDWKAALTGLPPDQRQQLLGELRARLAERRAQR